MKNYKVRTMRPPVSKTTLQALEDVMNYLEKQDGITIEQLINVKDSMFTLLLSEQGTYDIDTDLKIPAISCARLVESI